MGVKGYILFGLKEIPPMKLNARQVETATLKGKPYMMTDEGGFICLLTPIVLDTGA